MTSEQPPVDPASAGANNPGGVDAPMQAPVSGSALDPQAPQYTPSPMYPAYPPNAPYPGYPAYPQQGMYAPGAPYPYPPNVGYAAPAGYPPAGASAPPSGAYAPPSGAYAPPGEPAPDAAVPGAGYPQYPQYPAYPPQGAYPPPGAYPPNAAPPSAPYPSYAYPAAPSYPLYSPYASAPYGAAAPGTYPAGPQAPPAPQRPIRRRNALLPAILGGVGAVVIIALIAVGLLALRSNDGRPSAGSATPSVTGAASATAAVTPFPGATVFSDAVPGVCGDHPNQWNNDSQGDTLQCANGVMTLTHPSTDKYLATEYFVPPNYAFPASYQVSVKINQETAGCGGIFVLGATNNGDGYAAYICDDGGYELTQYLSDGTALTVDQNQTTSGVAHTLVIAVTPKSIDVSIDGQAFSSQSPVYTSTSYLALEVYGTSAATNATASFSNFVVTA